MRFSSTHTHTHKTKENGHSHFLFHFISFLKKFRYHSHCWRCQFSAKGKKCYWYWCCCCNSNCTLCVFVSIYALTVFFSKSLQHAIQKDKHKKQWHEMRKMRMQNTRHQDFVCQRVWKREETIKNGRNISISNVFIPGLAHIHSFFFFSPLFMPGVLPNTWGMCKWSERKKRPWTRKQDRKHQAWWRGGGWRRQLWRWLRKATTQSFKC